MLWFFFFFFPRKSEPGVDVLWGICYPSIVTVAHRPLSLTHTVPPSSTQQHPLILILTHVCTTVWQKIVLGLVSCIFDSCIKKLCGDSEHRKVRVSASSQGQMSSITAMGLRSRSSDSCDLIPGSRCVGSLGRCCQMNICLWKGLEMVTGSESATEICWVVTGMQGGGGSHVGPWKQSITNLASVWIHRTVVKLVERAPASLQSAFPLPKMSLFTPPARMPH